MRDLSGGAAPGSPSGGRARDLSSAGAGAAAGAGGGSPALGPSAAAIASSKIMMAGALGVPSQRPAPAAGGGRRPPLGGPSNPLGRGPGAGRGRAPPRLG